jgi:hypothetical protein
MQVQGSASEHKSIIRKVAPVMQCRYMLLIHSDHILVLPTLVSEGMLNGQLLQPVLSNMPMSNNQFLYSTLMLHAHTVFFRVAVFSRAPQHN